MKNKIWEYIIIHHSLTKDTKTVSWDAIKRYHKETLGWFDIGYHYGIELVGNEYKILRGRDINEDGAHCKEKGMNHKAIGICCVGNFDLEPVPKRQFDILVLLTEMLQAQFLIPSKNVYRHTDFAKYKTCPGKKFQWKEFKSRLGDLDIYINERRKELRKVAQDRLKQKEV